MIGYKGFDKDMKCSPNGSTQQYAVGATVEHKGARKLCVEGVHFCLSPFDVFRYYSPGKSRYAEVEADGVADQKQDDSKRVCSKLFIKAELTLEAMINASVNFVFSLTKASDKTNATSGPYSRM